jgi:hypothetical protein
MIHPSRSGRRWLVGLLAAASWTVSLPIARTAEPSEEAKARPARDPIDWSRAQRLYDRKQRGEALSTEDEAYLERAKTARKRGQAGRGQGGEPPKVDWVRVGEAYDKVRSGQTVNDEERRRLIQALRAIQRIGPMLRGRRDRPAGPSGPRPAAPPATERTGLVPLDQMAAQDVYKGEDGGLYGGGRNVPPPAQQQAARRELARIVPLDANGKPVADGKVVLISIGMSNTTQECSRFKELADRDPAKWSKLVIVDGAQGGQDAERWSTDDKPAWGRLMQRLQHAGVTPQQVQVAWIKHARMGPARYGEYPKHAEELVGHVRRSLQIARNKFPNLRVAYLSSRIYAGYARTGLNPEPYAYESAFAVRRLILDQIKGDAALNCDPAKGKVKAPLLLWGPYLWADGLTPRKSDGLVWKREDLGADGTHPSGSGRDKVARLLLGLCKNDPNAKSWFTGPGPAAAK